MAPTSISWNKLLNIRKMDKNWKKYAVDINGNPTDDPIEAKTLFLLVIIKVLV